MDPSRRFLTIILATGTVVLLASIAIGERMGDRVLTSAVNTTGLQSIAITPAPVQTTGPLGPDWKRSQALAAAPDPKFPDPRIPPMPLPTPLPRPTYSPKPATPTPNPNIPIWRQQPLPTATPVGSPSPEATGTGPVPTGSLVPGPSPAPPM